MTDEDVAHYRCILVACDGGVERAPSRKRMAKILVTYAAQPRDSHIHLAFFGNDAREVLAEYLGVPVTDLEPGTSKAVKLLADILSS